MEEEQLPVEGSQENVQESADSAETDPADSGDEREQPSVSEPVEVAASEEPNTVPLAGETSEDKPQPEPEKTQAQKSVPNSLVRCAVTLVCEVRRDSFENVKGDIRDTLLSHAKREWVNEIGNVTTDQVSFTNC